jgi:bla regulator protein BlaR1
MIDGKEATEKDMKKLPVSEIEKVSVNKDKEMVDKYGDKAKNGVVFITTKKPK